MSECTDGEQQEDVPAMKDKTRIYSLNWGVWDSQFEHCITITLHPKHL